MQENDTELKVALGIIQNSLIDIKDDIMQLRQAQNMNVTTYVTRNEWALRNQTVNDKFSAQGREIGDLRAELRGRRVHWTAIASLLVAVGVFFWTVVGPAIVALP